MKVGPTGMLHVPKYTDNSPLGTEFISDATSQISMKFAPGGSIINMPYGSLGLDELISQEIQIRLYRRILFQAWIMWDSCLNRVGSLWNNLPNLKNNVSEHPWPSGKNFFREKTLTLVTLGLGNVSKFTHWIIWSRLFCFFRFLFHFWQCHHIITRTFSPS